MKTTILLPFILLLTLGSSPLLAQTRVDSTTAGARHERQASFIDEDGDGIDDRVAGRGKGLQRGKDRFIDRDGDGICDDRASGLGFRRGRSEAGTVPDIKGKGSPNRQGNGGK